MRYLLALLLALPAFACTKDHSFYAAGASLNKAATPNLAGLFVVAVPLTCDTSTWQVYSFTQHDVIPQGHGVNLTFKEVTSSGFATPLKQMGPINIYAIGNLGVATEGGSAEIAGAYGAVAVFPLGKKTPWRGLIGAQKIAGNKIYSVLFGRSW